MALVYDSAGIRMTDAKRALLANRVSRRMRALGIGTTDAYLAYLEGADREQELVHFLDVVTTNFTSFFREADHFALLQARLSAAIHKGERRFRLWSAACSSGQEPYSMAMVVLEAARGARVDVRVLATDLSTEMLELAREGTYSEQQIEGLPAPLRARYLEGVGPAGPGRAWRVTEPVRRLVMFRRMNLAKPPFALRTGCVDFAFCRNVMIYFDAPVRQALIRQMQRVLVPGGILAIGHTETLHGLDTDLVSLRPSVYALAGGSAAARAR